MFSGTKFIEKDVNGVASSVWGEKYGRPILD